MLLGRIRFSQVPRLRLPSGSASHGMTVRGIKGFLAASINNLFIHAFALRNPDKPLDISSKKGIINNEERTTHAVAPQLKLSDAVCTARQPSLGRVAVVLFAMRFTDGDGHCVLQCEK